MGLTSDLVSEFVKITNDNRKRPDEKTVFGTVSTDGTQYYVKIDGSDQLTPVSTTSTIADGDRVRLNIRDHTAIVTGNVSDPSVGVKRAGSIEGSIKNFGDKLEFQVSDKEGSLASKITMVSNRIDSEVLDETNGLASKVVQMPNQITSAVKATYIDPINQTIDGEGGLKARLSEAESNIKQMPDSITSTVKATYIDPINGEMNEFSEFQQTVEGFAFMNKGGTVKISGGDINLTGAIKFSDLSDAKTKQTEIDKANNNASDAQSTANSAAIAAASAKSTANDVDGTLTALLSSTDTSTYIDGKKIKTGSIYANRLHLGGSLSVYTSATGTTAGGTIGYDKGFNSIEGIGVRHTSSTGQVVCTNEAARLSYGGGASIVTSTNGSVTLNAVNHSIYLERNDTVVAQIYNDGASDMFIPGSDDKIYLGKSNKYWIAVYASNYYGGTAAATTSDANCKNSIEDLPDKYVKMYDMLRPVRYKLNNGKSNRYHVGYIAQEVEEAMIAAGIDSQEFGGFIKDVDENGEITYMLRYDEYDAIRDAKIKRLENDILAVKSENEELKARIEKLEKLLTQNT